MIKDIDATIRRWKRAKLTAFEVWQQLGHPPRAVVGWQRVRQYMIHWWVIE